MIALRADKTNRNRDDFRVLMAGIIFAIFLMVSNGFFMKMWDDFVSAKPFVSATLEIKDLGKPEPYVLYDADATQQVDGVWVASIVDTNNAQIMTRRGDGSYNDNIDGPRLWTWAAFFDNDKGLNDPGVPNVPFKVCVRYIVEARDSGATDESPTYCSKIFDPKG